MPRPTPNQAQKFARLAAAGIVWGLGLVLAACVTETTGPPQPAKPDLHEAARINTQLGWNYASQGLLDVAEVKLKKAVDQDENLAEAHSGLGYVYAQRNNSEDARTEYRRAIALDGDDPEIRNNYGVFLCNTGKYADGDSNFMLALKNRNYTTPAKAWTNAGVCAHQAGDRARSEANFRHALQIDPNYPGALYQLAFFDFEAENYIGTRAFVERYLKASAPTPDLLLLGYKTERALGNDDGSQQYSIKLIRNFPESKEAAQLLKLRAAP